MSLNAQRFARTHKHEIATGNFAPMHIYTPEPVAAPVVPSWDHTVIARCAFGQVIHAPSFVAISYKRTRKHPSGYISGYARLLKVVTITH